MGPRGEGRREPERDGRGAFQRPDGLRPYSFVGSR
jgi:hypothetical protein